MSTLAETMSLDGRTALVVGGAGGIGSAAVETLEELGARVVVADLDEARLGPHASAGRLTIAADASDPAGAERVIRHTVGSTGRLDVLVHSAAVTGASLGSGWGGAALEDQRVDAWETALRVNLTSVFLLARASARALRESGRGSIVLVSSIYGAVGPDPALYEGTEMLNPAAYGASKGGLDQLTRYLATTLAPDVRANAIAPGGVERGQPAIFRKRYVARTPLGRMAREDDMKGAIAYFASDLSAYVTGQVLHVDGGWTAW